MLEEVWEVRMSELVVSKFFSQSWLSSGLAAEDTTWQTIYN